MSQLRKILFAVAAFGGTATAVGAGTFASFTNIDKARIFGVEAQATWRPVDGLWINANYTFIDSEGVSQSTLSSTDPDVAAGRVANVDTGLLPLQNLSKHTANFATFYETDRWSARLAYTWRSEFLITVRDVIVPFAPIMNEDTGQLDGSIFYTVNDNWKIGVQAVNLLNEITRTSQVLNNDLLTAPRSWFMNDRRFTLVARANF